MPWTFVYLPPTFFKYTVVHKDFGFGPTPFASPVLVRNILHWRLLPTSCLLSLHLGSFPMRCGDQTDHGTVAMASNPISRPRSGDETQKQVLQPSSPSGQTTLSIVLIGLKMKRLHQCVCSRFQHSRPLITGAGLGSIFVYWSGCRQVEVAPAENNRDRREIGAALCSADAFLRQVSHQTSVEDGLKRSNTVKFASVLKCVENAKAESSY